MLDTDNQQRQVLEASTSAGIGFFACKMPLTQKQKLLFCWHLLSLTNL